MSIGKFLKEYGTVVSGFDVRVVNEREARAAAGIMGTLGMIIIFVAIGFSHTLTARIFISFLFIDLTIRIINPNYSPFLLLGRFFVQNQKPEYVGAKQKRFAWMIGWFITLPLLWWFVINWDINFYKVLICVACILLAFLESAFGICLGCYIYKFIAKDDPQHCPGGACGLNFKDPIQTFNPFQKVIVALTMGGLIIGTYAFLAFSTPTTFFGEFLHRAVLTDAQLQEEIDTRYQKAVAEEFGSDDEEDEE